LLLFLPAGKHFTIPAGNFLPVGKPELHVGDFQLIKGMDATSHWFPSLLKSQGFLPFKWINACL
jgi:hypothetical protein